MYSELKYLYPGADLSEREAARGRNYNKGYIEINISFDIISETSA